MSTTEVKKYKPKFFKVRKRKSRCISFFDERELSIEKIGFILVDTKNGITNWDIPVYYSDISCGILEMNNVGGLLNSMITDDGFTPSKENISRLIYDLICGCTSTSEHKAAYLMISIANSYSVDLSILDCISEVSIPVELNPNSGNIISCNIINLKKLYKDNE